jgi:hypothetical protein
MGSHLKLVIKFQRFYGKTLTPKIIILNKISVDGIFIDDEIYNLIESATNDTETLKQAFDDVNLCKSSDGTFIHIYY